MNVLDEFEVVFPGRVLMTAPAHVIMRVTEPPELPVFGVQLFRSSSEVGVGETRRIAG
jgi:hypothetical protein